VRVALRLTPANRTHSLDEIGNLVVMRRTQFTDDHDLFRESFRTFVEREMTPRIAEWNDAGIVDRELFATAGASGFLGMAVPEEYGGGGVDDFRYSQIIGEELQYAGAAAAGLGMTLHTDICLPYFLSLATDEQRARWLPGIVSGELITAIGMTEPGIGSDLASMSTTAVRDGDHYVVNGAKTFITNGINADLVITAVKTDPTQKHAGMSLLVVERAMVGFERGRNLEKVGLHAQDTAELFFTDVHVPVDNLLGVEGKGFAHLVDNLPQERLSIAVAGVAAAEAALRWTLDYVKQRTAFGSPIASFQNTRFALAEMRTEVDVAQVFVDRCVEALNAGELTVEEAAEAKWWCTELQKRTVDRCVQLHGGYGYMLEYPIARAYVDARVTTIYGGTTEIMKEIIGRKITRG
jgi:alkylation response protein AidB-like acyl-CoA dehydrogenase